MRKRKDEQPPRKCQHVDIRTWTSEHKGVTRPIRITWHKCNDCGHTWNEVSD